MALDSIATARTEIAKIYVAAFDRVPDAGGLTNWVNQYNAGLMTYDQIAEKFTASTEYVNKYPATLTNADLVTQLYSNVFGRAVDQSGLDNWTNQLAHSDISGINRTNIVSKLLDTATANPANADGLRMDNIANFSVDALSKNVSVDTATAQIANITADAATVTAAEDVVFNAGKTYSLTTASNDSIVGTTADDVISAPAGTLQNNDVVLDSTTTDNDTLNATVTSNNIQARIQDVENINITGKYVTTGFDLLKTTGTDTLTLSTDLAGGTATVSDANSINDAKIVAGNNIATLNVSSLASGTRDTVTVDAGSANAKLTGVTTGTDKYDVSLASGKTLTLKTMGSAGDAVSVNATGDFTLVNSTIAANRGNLGLTITNNGASAITVTESDTSAMAKTVALAGNDITIDANDGKPVDGVSITSSVSDSTIKLSATTGAAVALNKAVVGNVDIAANASAGTVTVNQGSQVTLSKDAGGLTLDVDDAQGNLTTNGTTGTLLLDVNASQATSTTTGSHVDTLLLKAGALADDAKGNHQIVTIANLTVDPKTDTTVIQGANDLTITKFTGDITPGVLNSSTAPADLITATGMTGNLKIGAFTQDAKVYAGSGDDSITTATANAFEIHGGAGNDTIDLNTTANASAGSKVYGDAGNDTIKTSTAGSIVDGGAGDDTIVSNGTDTVTLGDGADTFKTVTINNASTISDFTLGTDTIVLQGTLAGNLDLTNMSQTSSKYDMDGDASDDDLTLTGVTASDLSNSVQLDVNDGGAALTIVGGAKDDTIIATAASDITTGAGADIVGTGISAGATVKDFTTGTDKIVLSGTSTGTIDLTSVTPSTGAYDVNGDSTADFTLTGHTETDLTSMVQLGDSTTAFTTDATAASAVTGSTFDDYIAAGAGFATTVNFIDNGGVDTISAFVTGTDKLSFNAMTGIDTTATNAAASAATAHINDAVDGSVYILNNTAVNSDTIDFSALTVNSTHQVNNADVTYTSDSFVTDVAGYINNVLGTTTGEHYVVAIEGGNVNANANTDTLLYKVDGDTSGITASDIHLIGLATTAGTDVSVATGDIA